MNANPEPLRVLVDAVLDAAIRVRLRAHRLQAIEQTGLGGALQALRTYWGSSPGCSWQDAEDEEPVRCAEVLIALLDERAQELITQMRDSRKDTV